METLLMTAVVLITLAVLTQAGVLIAMYLMSRRVADKAEVLMNESRKLIAPLESITSNLKTVSNDLAETGKIARQQALHIQELVTETQQSVRGNISEVRSAVRETVSEARSVVMRPIRHYAAIASGIAEGISTFLFGHRRSRETGKRTDEKYPAA